MEPIAEGHVPGWVPLNVRRVRVRGFRSIREIDLALGPRVYPMLTLRRPELTMLSLDRSLVVPWPHRQGDGWPRTGGSGKTERCRWASLSLYSSPCRQ